MSAAFLRTIRDSGIPIDDGVIADGRLHRVHVDGDKAGTRNAWYVLHDGDFPAGAFGCNKRGISGKWRAHEQRQELTYEDRVRIEADRTARALAQERAYSEAAAKAAQILQRATREALQHLYCVRKGIEPHGVKVNRHGLLVIPIYSVRNGKLQTVQLIDRNGNKKMLTGGRAAGGCYPFADVPHFWDNARHDIGVCEGWATGATLAESLPNVAMFAAFSAGNLLAVSQALRARFTVAELTLFGDNDISGIGQKYAHQAAFVVGGLVAIAPIPGCDWNDVRRAA